MMQLGAVGNAPNRGRVHYNREPFEQRAGWREAKARGGLRHHLGRKGGQRPGLSVAGFFRVLGCQAVRAPDHQYQAK